MPKRKWLLSVEFDTDATTEDIIKTINDIFPDPDALPGATITARSIQELGTYVEKEESNDKGS